MYVATYPVTVTTGAASGAGTGYTPNVTGKVLQIRYVKPGADSFTDGYTTTITTEATGVSILSEAAINASATRNPRQAVHSTTGGAGSDPATDYIYVANERIAIAVATAGNSKTGTYYVTIG